MKSSRSEIWCAATEAKPAALARLLCFPYAGANASIFSAWHRQLPVHLEVRGIQLPGRRNRLSEASFTRMLPLVNELGEALVPFLDRPFIFFGHSMGAIVSFEIARWLRRNRKPTPDTLFVSARRAPQIPDKSAALHLMSDAEFITEIRHLSGTPPELLDDPHILRMILPALRADTELCETYQYTSDVPLSCPIVAFCGQDDAEETPERMQEWAAQTTANFHLHVLAGDHFFIHSSECELFELLRNEMTTP